MLRAQAEAGRQLAVGLDAELEAMLMPPIRPVLRIVEEQGPDRLPAKAVEGRTERPRILGRAQLAIASEFSLVRNLIGGAQEPVALVPGAGDRLDAARLVHLGQRGLDRRLDVPRLVLVTMAAAPGGGKTIEVRGRAEAVRIIGVLGLNPRLHGDTLALFIERLYVRALPGRQGHRNRQVGEHAQELLRRVFVPAPAQGSLLATRGIPALNLI